MREPVQQRGLKREYELVSEWHHTAAAQEQLNGANVLCQTSAKGERVASHAQGG
jgi:hypothetical protein